MFLLHLVELVQTVPLTFANVPVKKQLHKDAIVSIQSDHCTSIVMHLLDHSGLSATSVPDKTDFDTIVLVRAREIDGYTERTPTRRHAIPLGIAGTAGATLTPVVKRAAYQGQPIASIGEARSDTFARSFVHGGGLHSRGFMVSKSQRSGEISSSFFAKRKKASCHLRPVTYLRAWALLRVFAAKKLCDLGANGFGLVALVMCSDVAATTSRRNRNIDHCTVVADLSISGTLHRLGAAV